MTSRQVLAGIGYEGGTGRLRDIFNGRHLPIPETLRDICDITGAPFLEAVARYGYYREFIAILDRLVSLGEQWLEDDDARGGTFGADGKPASRLQSLRDTGVLYWNGTPVKDLSAQQARHFRGRYIIASWDELEHEAVRVTYPPLEADPGGTTTLTVPLVLSSTDPALRRETVRVPVQHYSTVLPKPIALALTLAMLTFSRRGDVYKNDALDYRQRLYAPADALVNLAEQSAAAKKVGRPKLLHPLLAGAVDALSDRVRPFDDRRVIAGEHIVAWARAVCRPYAEYAQLATFEELGEAGSQRSTFTSYRSAPQRYNAELPSIDSLIISS